MRRLVVLIFVLALLAPAVAGAQSDPPDSAPRRFIFGGFGNLVVAHSEKRNREVFETGELDLYGIWRLSTNWSILGEGFIQHAGPSKDIDLEPTKRVEFNIERLHASYSSSDRFRLEVGEVHTGIIRWNEREHRGRFLQTPIDVPSIANRQEQGGAWPLHFFGGWASGRLPGPAGFQYGVGIGEARGEHRDDIEPPLGHRTTPSMLLSLSASPVAVPGLDAGVAEYAGDIPAPDGTLRERDTTLFASYVRGGLELRSEWAEMIHRPLSGGQQFISRGWYVLASFRAHGRLQSLRPYFILDRLNVAPGEEYLDGVFDQRAWALGIRWDARSWLALKADAGNHLTPDGVRERLIRAAVTFAF